MNYIKGQEFIVCDLETEWAEQTLLSMGNDSPIAREGEDFESLPELEKGLRAKVATLTICNAHLRESNGRCNVREGGRCVVSDLINDLYSNR